MKTYAVGDLHGMSALLRRALKFIAKDSGDEAARVVFLGDYVDRGPDSRGILDTLMTGPSQPNHFWTPLLGNHDQLMEQAFAGDLSALETWFANGAEQTIASFGL